MVDLSNMIEMVKFILEDNHAARDSDILLQKVIHFNEYKRKGMEYEGRTRLWIDYLNDISINRLSKPETIRRARRKCQELYPTTRGNRYISRQANQKEIKDGLKLASERRTNNEPQTTIW
tara:strand:- start:1519 stop:1878 length:360 start_codon:yes stop_codon:yes gene_type:complete